MKQLPALTTSSAEGDVVVVTGTVRGLSAPMLAPLSQRLCTWFESRAGTFEQRGAQRFIIVREGAVAIVVDPTHAYVALPMQPQRAFENHSALVLRLEHRDHDGPATPYETIVEVGARISVAARLGREPAAPAIYRDTPTELLLVGSADEPLVIVDAD
jgi:hypothetical protein